jgi:hypothetical protein
LQKRAMNSICHPLFLQIIQFLIQGSNAKAFKFLTILFCREKILL